MGTSTPLLALAAAAAVLLASGAAAQGVPYWSNDTKVIKVCTSEYTPMVYCTDRTPEDYGGYEIELFRRVADLLGWEPSMLEWHCMDWDELIGHLVSADGRCDLAVAGITVNENFQDQGITFSWPTCRNGLSILTQSQGGGSYSIWSFFDAFEWQVWVVTAATVLVVPFIIWGIDWLAYGGRWPKGVSAAEVALSKYFWESVGRPAWLRGQYAVSWAGNTIITVYAFVITVLFALYIGYATSNLTTSMLDSQITGVTSLPGKAVGTWTDYAENLQKYGVAPATFPWDDAADEAQMISELKSGAIKALVLDASILNYMASSDCALSVVGERFDLYEQAVAFPKGFNNTELLDAFNEALNNLTFAGVVEEVAAQELLPADAPKCKASDSSGGSSAITFHQVAGLWIVLAGAVGIGLVLVLLHILHVRYTRPVLAKSAAVQSFRRLGSNVSQKMTGASVAA